MRTYSELISLPTFEERLEYLRTNNKIGDNTFGFERWLNQYFYKTPEWKRIRNFVIARDNGCDLACSDRPIPESLSQNGRKLSNIVVHHMNPVDPSDIKEHNINILAPEFLITCSFWTHEAITYGYNNERKNGFAVREPGDTCPWR